MIEIKNKPIGDVLADYGVTTFMHDVWGPGQETLHLSFKRGQIEFTALVYTQAELDRINKRDHGLPPEEREDITAWVVTEKDFSKPETLARQLTHDLPMKTLLTFATEQLPI